MKKIDFKLKTHIHFGTDILEEALNKEQGWIKGNVLIVTTGRSLIKYGYVNRLAECLHRLEYVKQITVFDNVSANPELEETMEAVKLGKETGTDVVIGFGGGSAIDAAKAAAVGIANVTTLEQMEEYLLYGKEPEDNTLPVIAIPTTAGTGSELSKGAILSSRRHHVKAGIRGRNIQPKAAIVDAAFTCTVPEKITMETGFDVLSHAIESYVSVKADMLSETLSEKAARLASKNLTVLGEDTNNRTAREEMCFASMIMGINLANVGTCIPHRMQYPIGIKTGTSHGAGLIALYPAWMQYEYGVNRDRINNVLSWMGLEQAENGQEAKEQMQLFQKKLGIRYSLDSLGIKRAEAEKLVHQVRGNLANDRLYRKDDILLKIMEDAF